MTTPKTSLAAIIWNYLHDIRIDFNERIYRHILRKHHIYTTGDTRHHYWINFVRAIGGGEKAKPCEFVFDSPWQARMHEEVTRTCSSWEFVCTVEVCSPIELDVTDYQWKVDHDEEYSRIIDEMIQKTEDTSLKELRADRDRMNQGWARELEAVRKPSRQ